MSTALIDADVLKYRFAFSNQEVFEWDEGEESVYLDLDNAKKELDAFVEWILERTGCTDLLLCISSDWNYRLKLNPTYKDNRDESQKPKLLDDLVEHMKENYPYIQWMHLEADDMLGILMTQPANKGKYVCCTIDKDLKQIPGRHFNWNHDKLFTVSSEEAETFFYQQILQGDPTDGYHGCPGVGPVKAAEILKSPYLVVPYEHTFTRGKRKGETETRYRKEPTEDLWEAILSHYAQQGKDEEYVILQARMARILQHGEYDLKTEEVKLWNKA
nr:hypothetical protein 10 [Deltaproteobacteria bacterium]